jgi:hypothetical protein
MGGPLAEADLGSVKIARGAEGRCDPHGGVHRQLEQVDKLDEKARDIEPGDTIFIDSPSFSMRDLFTVLTTMAIITAAVSNAVIAARGL